MPILHSHLYAYNRSNLSVKSFFVHGIGAAPFHKGKEQHLEYSELIVLQFETDR